MPPTKGYKIHGMVCTATAAGLDVVNLQAVCTVAQGAPVPVPFVYRPSGFVVDVCCHFQHRPFCRLSCGIFHGAHEVKANATVGHASAHTGSLDRVVQWESRGKRHAQATKGTAT